MVLNALEMRLRIRISVGPDGQGIDHAPQGRSVGAQQERSFQGISRGLFQGKGRVERRVEPALAHDPVHQRPHLLHDLRHESGSACPSKPQVAVELLRVLDGGDSALDRDIPHQPTSTVLVRGMPGDPPVRVHEEEVDSQGDRAGSPASALPDSARPNL